MFVQTETAEKHNQGDQGWSQIPRSPYGTISLEIHAETDAAILAFGVDLLIPSLGGNARKTNYDYTKGQLDELLTVIIEEKAKLFVCAVGVPPKEAIKRLHDHGIVCMNVSHVNTALFPVAHGFKMVGHPKHVQKALDVGMDIICAQVSL